LNFCIPLLKKTAYKENLMPKFIITQTDRYEVEATSMEELRKDWHEAGGESAKYEYVILDGSTNFAPIQEGEADV